MTQQPARTDERPPAKKLDGIWDKFKALLERDKVELASLRVAVSPLLGSGSAGGGGGEVKMPMTGLEDCDPTETIEEDKGGEQVVLDALTTTAHTWESPPGSRCHHCPPWTSFTIWDLGV